MAALKGCAPSVAGVPVLYTQDSSETCPLCPIQNGGDVL